jgi:hypothetical protein
LNADAGDYFTTCGGREGGGRRREAALKMPMESRFSTSRARLLRNSIQIKDDFLSAIQRLLSFHRVMSAAESMSPEAGAWFVEADHVSVTALARRRSRARLEDARTRFGRVIIVASLFLALLTTALLFGGRAAIEPLLQSAEQARATMGTGEVVYTMPDGIFCRHVTFDNLTAEINEGGIARCTNDIAGKRPHNNRGFAWHASN